MSKNKFSWLQLSDLHIFESSEWNMMIDGYEKLAKKIHPDFIVVTGDYRHIKLRPDYSAALSFLNKIVEIFKLKKEDVFLVPGNHDIEDYEFRKETIRLISDEIDINPDIYIEYMKKTMCLSMAFNNYTEFVRSFYGNEVKDIRSLEPSSVMCIPWHEKINIIILNTALISDGDKTHKEIIDLEALSKLRINKEVPTIVLGHHDIDSIYESQKTRLKRIFESLGVRAYLCGDMHKEKIKMLSKYDIPNENIPCIVCGKSAVQYGDTYSDVGVIEYICKDDGYVYVIPYKWGEKYSFKKADDFLYDIDRDYRFKITDLKTQKSIRGNNKNNNSQELISGITSLVSKRYTDITQAHKDIAKDIQEGGCFEFYGERGATFIGESETNSIIREIKDGKNISVKLLISYPFSDKIRHRLQSIPDYLDDDECEKKWQDNYSKALSLLENYGNCQNVKIRFHDTPLVFRLLFTKNHLYLGYYEPGKHSKESALYRFESSTPTYQTYHAYFNYLWIRAYQGIPENIPAKYSFLKGYFPVQPSLVINTTSLCNMNCIYCPPGGENLYKTKKNESVSKSSLRRLICAFKSNIVKNGGIPVLRITGGEPLIDEENRKKVKYILEFAKDYKKIVFCTNGIFWDEAYKAFPKTWDSVKSSLLLKISLDTLNIERFRTITRTGEKAEELHKKLLGNIKLAKSKGFKIELNLVATKENLQRPEDVIEIFEYAQDLGLVGLKILTVNDFGGNVEVEQSDNEKNHITNILNEVINIMRKREYEEKDVYLNDDKGIQMHRFIAITGKDTKCTLTIVDHNTNDSITPRRTFSDFCRSCKYFPDSNEVKNGSVKACATGIMSLTLRADGLLSPCRLCPENGKYINNLQKCDQVVRIVDDCLKAYDACFHKTIKDGIYEII